ncbi:hypothetical protein J4573_32395 [Actinomadura barringtoniae]|uniref:Uncharacterized protein n=1 Tax=Actinomadura barringtoniae TaxID=1427535 RepID=A0A939PFR6_9ACTN|nr:hypothetical protein [Actinomadura barringtoniae]MBO2451826.1 hypothetical protein [Actinomadura barringtoniae]
MVASVSPVRSPRRMRPVLAPPVPTRVKRSRAAWLGLGLTAAGAAMIPWMYALAKQLPATTTVSNWSTAWVGLDAALALGLLSTGVLYTRNDPRHALTAAATAALLSVDAWFDVNTAAQGTEKATAIAMAGVEIPLAALCAALAYRGLKPAQPAQPTENS